MICICPYCDKLNVKVNFFQPPDMACKDRLAKSLMITKLKFPFPHMVSVLMRDRASRKLELMSQVCMQWSCELQLISLHLWKNWSYALVELCLFSFTFSSNLVISYLENLVKDDAYVEHKCFLISSLEYYYCIISEMIVLVKNINHFTLRCVHENHWKRIFFWYYYYYHQRYYNYCYRYLFNVINSGNSDKNKK